MKPESLVIVDQHATVNSYLSLVLPARHTLEGICVGSLQSPLGSRCCEQHYTDRECERPAQDVCTNWSEVVTR
jgi:hypothetical protein